MNTLKVSSFKHPDTKNYEKTQKYLHDMHMKGWKFVRMTPSGAFEFEECVPEDVIYQADCYASNVKNTAEYFQLFADCGWELILSQEYFHYFRKPASQALENESIFCDEQSRKQMRKRINRLWIWESLAFIIFYMIFSVVFDLITGESKTLKHAFYENVNLRSLFPVPVIIIIYEFFRTKSRNKIFGKENKENRKIIATTIKRALPVIFAVIFSFVAIKATADYFIGKNFELPTVESAEYAPADEPISLKALDEYFNVMRPSADICTNYDETHLQDYYFTVRFSDENFFIGNSSFGFSHNAGTRYYKLELTVGITREAYLQAAQNNDGLIDVSLTIRKWLGKQDAASLNDGDFTDEVITVKIPATNI